MKKLLVMLSTVALSTTNVHAINSVINNIKSNTHSNDIFMNSTLSNKLKISQFSIDQSVNWQEIKANINNTFSNYSASMTLSNEEQDMMAKARASTLEYLSKFEARDESYDNIIYELKTEFQDFRREFDKNWNRSSQSMSNQSINDDSEIWDNIGFYPPTNDPNDWGIGGPGDMSPPPINKPSDPTGNQPDEPKVPEQPELPPNVDVPDEIKNGQTINLYKNEESRSQAVDILNRIEIIGKTCSSLSVASGLVAAGFWAAAWFFGISVPFAVAATAASAALGISATTISFFLGVHEMAINEVKTSVLGIALNTFSGIMTEAKIYFVADFLITATVLTATSWVVPFVLGAFGVLTEIASWIFWVNPNILG